MRRGAQGGPNDTFHASRPAEADPYPAVLAAARPRPTPGFRTLSDRDAPVTDRSFINPPRPPPGLIYNL